MNDLPTLIALLSVILTAHHAHWKPQDSSFFPALTNTFSLNSKCCYKEHCCMSSLSPATTSFKHKLLVFILRLLTADRCPLYRTEMAVSASILSVTLAFIAYLLHFQTSRFVVFTSFMQRVPCTHLQSHLIVLHSIYRKPNKSLDD